MTEQERCPHIRTIIAGDVSFDMCGLVDKVCLLVGGYECETYEEIFDRCEEVQWEEGIEND